MTERTRSVMLYDPVAEQPEPPLDVDAIEAEILGRHDDREVRFVTRGDEWHMWSYRGYVVFETTVGMGGCYLEPHSCYIGMTEDRAKAYIDRLPPAVTSAADKQTLRLIREIRQLRTELGRDA